MPSSIVTLFLSLMCLVISLPVPALALQDGRTEVGLRGGLMAGKKHEYFHQYELFARYGLPWSWRNADGWGVDTNFEATAGALQAVGETGFIGSLGPGLSFNKSDRGPSADLGITVDALGRMRFGRQDFGTPYLFGAYLGLSWRWENASIEYRLLHLSNGHIFDLSAPNPGLDTHLVGLSWRF